MDAQKSMQTKKMNRIKSETKLTFPANSKLVNFFERKVFVDPIWVAKIVMPASSYENFKQAVLAKPVDDTIYDRTLASSTSWWKPTNVVLKKQYLADDQTFVVVVVSKEADEFAVYIECAMF